MQKLNIVGNSLQHINWYTLCIWYAIVTFMCSLRYTHWIFVLFFAFYFSAFCDVAYIQRYVCIYLIGLRLVRIIILFVETFFFCILQFSYRHFISWHSNIVFRKKKTMQISLWHGGDVELFESINPIIYAIKILCGAYP